MIYVSNRLRCSNVIDVQEDPWTLPREHLKNIILEFSRSSFLILETFSISDKETAMTLFSIEQVRTNLHNEKEFHFGGFRFFLKNETKWYE